MPAVSHFCYDSEDLETCAKNLVGGKLVLEAKRCLLVERLGWDRADLQGIP